MLNKTILLSAFFLLTMGVEAQQLPSQSGAAQSWTLPHLTAVHDSAAHLPVHRGL